MIDHRTTISRRRLVQAAAAGILMPGMARAESITDVPSLGAIAEARGIYFGTAFDQAVLDNPKWRDLYRHQARILTADYSMKFAALRPEENVTTFQPADRLANFAEANQIPLRGHCLVWNEFNPGWVAKLSASRREYWMDRHIEEVMTHYAGRIQSWDVVNEPFWVDHGHPGGFRGGPWYDAMGRAYIKRAFLRASQVDKTVKLALNEAGAEWVWGPTAVHRAGVLKLIDEIRDAGARIDIVGLESHWMDGLDHNAGSLTEFLGRIAEKKVEIYISEIDVEDKKMPDDIAKRDEIIAHRYSTYLETVLRQPAVKAIITWELADGASWYKDEYKAPPGSNRRPRPLPFDEDCRPKPAFEAIARALRGRKVG